MNQPIIAGYDDQDGGIAAVELAATLADRKPNVDLVVAHVYTNFVTSWYGLAGPYDEVERERGRKLLERAQERFANLPAAAYRLVRGLSPAQGLQALAENLDAAYIVVGRSHLGPVGRVLEGSDAEMALRLASCPVAVAPTEGRRHTLGHPVVGVAYDASPEAEAALEHAIDLARDLSAELRLLHVADIPTDAYLAYGGPDVVAAHRESARTELQAAADQVQHRSGLDLVTTSLIVGAPGPVLAHASEDLTMLVVGSRKYGPVRRVVLGSVSTHLVRHAACPLVVLPRTAETPPTELDGTVTAEHAEQGAAS